MLTGSVSPIKKNLAYTVLLSLSQAMLPLVTFPYVSRVLHPAGTGLVAFTDSFTQIFIVIAAFGITVYGVKEVAKAGTDQSRLNKIFSELLTIHLISMLLCMGAYLTLILSLPRLNADTDIFLVGTGILFFSAFQIEWFFQGIERFQYIAKRTILLRLVIIALLFILVKDQYDAIWYYSLNLLSFLGSAVWNGWYARRFVTYSWRNMELKKHLPALFFLFSVSVVISIYTTCDTILLGFLSDEIHVGYYANATRIIKIFSGALFSLVVVLVPRQTVVFQENKPSRIAEFLGRSIKMVVFITVPLAVGSLINASEIISIISGPSFGPAGNTLRIAAPGIVILGMAHIFAQQILLPLGKEKQVLKAVLSGALVSVCLNLLLIPGLEQNGAAISNLIAELCVTSALFYFCSRIIPVPSFLKQVITGLVSCILFYPVAVLCRLADAGMIITFGATVLLSGSAYFCMQWFIFRNELVIEQWNLIMRKVKEV